MPKILKLCNEEKKVSRHTGLHNLGKGLGWFNDGGVFFCAGVGYGFFGVFGDGGGGSCCGGSCCGGFVIHT